jgi:hypothetical protein
VREWAGIMTDAFSVPRLADIRAALPQARGSRLTEEARDVERADGHGRTADIGRCVLESCLLSSTNACGGAGYA